MGLFFNGVVLVSQSIMIVGTTSHAGKSLLTAVLCRILKRQGYRVTPFKGQNMALNAYVTEDGLEMGHAQAVQAWAAGVEPQVEMNPILLKPQGDMTSQVVLLGKPVGRVQAADYYQQYFERGWETITECLEKLRESYDWIVCEGAGSPAEINLKHRDLTNMRVAKYLNAPTLLVADIDRGGVFAHIVGTLELLDPDERDLVKGIVINKFRGQRSLLDSGIEWLEQRTGIPVVGVIPWISNSFPAEDSLSLLERNPVKQNADLTIAVIRLPRVANFTDFDPLAAEPSVQLRYVAPGDNLGQPDAVILPGSKTTVSDLLALETCGLTRQLRTYCQQGGHIFGICGGFQMLGDWIMDEQGLEGQQGTVAGLGLLPITTAIAAAKTTQRRKVQSQSLPIEGWCLDSRTIEGYEIHQGQSTLSDPENGLGLVPLFSDPVLGYFNPQNLAMGTYLHDVFNNGTWRRAWLNSLRYQKGLAPLPLDVESYTVQREQMLSQLAEVIQPYLNLKPFGIASNP
jgi:adenosylcobyric acid synthase